MLTILSIWVLPEAFSVLVRVHGVVEEGTDQKNEAEKHAREEDMAHPIGRIYELAPVSVVNALESKGGVEVGDRMQQEDDQVEVKLR